MNNQFSTNLSGMSRQAPLRPESWLKLMQEPVARQIVIDAICELFNRWHLHPINQAALLGLSDMIELKKYVSSDIEPSVFIHIGHLLAIDRELLKRFPALATQRDQWIWQQLPRLQNQMPIIFMLREGLEGIRFIRYLLETGDREDKVVYM